MDFSRIQNIFSTGFWGLKVSSSSQMNVDKDGKMRRKNTKLYISYSPKNRSVYSVETGFEKFFKSLAAYSW